MEVTPVPVLYSGSIEELGREFGDFHKLHNFDGVEKEGYVIRIADEFKMQDFHKSVAKYVGPNFVLPHGHWTKSWTVNKLA